VKFLLILVLLLGGCHPLVQVPVAQKYSLPTYTPEPLPAPIETREKLPAKTALPYDMLQGDEAPFNGILIDAYLAMKYKLIVAERDRLRTQVAIDRKTYSQIYDLTNRSFQEMAQRAERSWWELNKGMVGFWVGTTLALGFSVLTVFALDHSAK
jgi:hypothetical protein